MVRDALSNDRQRRACRPDRLEAAQDVVERSIYRYAFQVRELTATRSEVRVHQNVGLERTAEPALTLSGAARERGHLAVVLG
jgi:hypothetical protein